MNGLVRQMNRHHSHRKPDFFAVILVLVMIGFGLTLAIQVSAVDHHQVVDSEEIKVIMPNAG